MAKDSMVMCEHCGKRRPGRFGTDGFGVLVDETEPCGCGKARNKRGLCRLCDGPIAGRAWFCPACRAVRRREASNRYHHSDKGAAGYDRNLERRRCDTWRARSRISNRTYREEHPERVRVWRRRAAINQTGASRARKRAYDQRNRERRNERERQRRVAKREELRAYHRAYYEQVAKPRRAAKKNQPLRKAA